MKNLFEKIKKIFGEYVSQEETSVAQRNNNVGIGTEKLAEYCPHCHSTKFVKKGNRKKKLETVQLYRCRVCEKVFTSQLIKGNRFPSNVIIDGLSYYNLGFGLEDTCRSKLT